MNRRWVCASRSAKTSPRARVRMSSHGDSFDNGPGRSGVWKMSSAVIICVQVVPHFGGVLITMSSDRSRNPSHRPLS